MPFMPAVAVVPHSFRSTRSLPQKSSQCCSGQDGVHKFIRSTWAISPTRKKYAVLRRPRTRSKPGRVHGRCQRQFGPAPIHNDGA
jgi:hypothetical protein